jgi:hypothetical protein
MKKFMVLLLMSASAFGVKIVTTSLPGATIDECYSQEVKISAGCSPLIWTLVGSLPPGLTGAPDSADGGKGYFITGTPTASGVYWFTLDVKGCEGGTASKQYELTVGGGSSYSVDLSWSASTSSNVLGYNLFRSTTNGGPYTQINPALIAGTTYQDTSVAAGKTYYYVTTTVNASGEQSARSAQAVAAIP